MSKKYQNKTRATQTAALELADIAMPETVQVAMAEIAGSMREGMAETLTILHLDVPPALARTLRSTHPIESMIGICRDHAANVKNWRDGQMALRWCAAGMIEAGKQFRKVNGFMHLGKLRASLERHVAAKTAGADQVGRSVA